MSYSVGAVNWNGLNIKPALRYWEEHPALGSVDDSGAPAVLDVRVAGQAYLSASAALSAAYCRLYQRLGSLGVQGHSTFFPPYVPELNEYYGRELHYHYARIRSEPRSIWQSISLLPTSPIRRDLTCAATAGSRRGCSGGSASSPLPAGPGRSQPADRPNGRAAGLPCLQDRRRPDTHQQARSRPEFYAQWRGMTIGNADPSTNKPRFEPFEDLFIAQRAMRRKLTPHDALDFLLERGVFQVGLSSPVRIANYPSGYR